MKRTFTASITHEANWYIARCLEVDVVSQGETAEKTHANVGAGFTLSFTPPI